MHGQQVHTFDDGTKITMMGDAILVKIDAVPTKTAGGLHMPGNAVEHVHNSGTILAFGEKRFKKTGKTVPLLDEDLIGMKCVFIRYLDQQDSNKQIRAMFSDDHIRLKLTDILVTYDPEEDGDILG